FRTPAGHPRDAAPPVELEHLDRRRPDAKLERGRAARRQEAAPGADDGRADRRMAGEGKPAGRRPDVDAWRAAGTFGWRDEGDLGPAELAGEAEPSIVIDRLGAEEDGELVARERALGEDVAEDEFDRHFCPPVTNQHEGKCEVLVRRTALEYHL